MEQSISLYEGYARLKRTRAAFMLALIFGLVLLIGIAVTLGSADLGVAESYLAILAGLFPGRFSAPELAITIVWDYRLHRVLFAVCAGFGLAVAGSVMQGILRNPLASPFTLGIASAAATGASIAIVMGAGVVGGEYLIIGNAFLFALLAAFAIYGMARYEWARGDVAAGIALMSLLGGDLAPPVCWQQKPGGGILDVRVGLTSQPGETRDRCACPCLPSLTWYTVPGTSAPGRGDEVAAGLRVPVERSMTVMMLIASLITAVIICFTGTIRVSSGLLRRTSHA